MMGKLQYFVLGFRYPLISKIARNAEVLKEDHAHRLVWQVLGTLCKHCHFISRLLCSPMLLTEPHLFGGAFERTGPNMGHCKVRYVPSNKISPDRIHTGQGKVTEGKQGAIWGKKTEEEEATNQREKDRGGVINSKGCLSDFRKKDSVMGYSEGSGTGWWDVEGVYEKGLHRRSGKQS